MRPHTTIQRPSNRLYGACLALLCQLRLESLLPLLQAHLCFEAHDGLVRAGPLLLRFREGSCEAIAKGLKGSAILLVHVGERHGGRQAQDMDSRLGRREVRRQNSHLSVAVVLR